jgi:hypothetical protein
VAHSLPGENINFMIVLGAKDLTQDVVQFWRNHRREDNNVHFHVHPVGRPDVVARVEFRQLAIYDDQP